MENKDTEAVKETAKPNKLTNQFGNKPRKVNLTWKFLAIYPIQHGFNEDGSPKFVKSGEEFKGSRKRVRRLFKSNMIGPEGHPWTEAKIEWYKEYSKKKEDKAIMLANKAHDKRTANAKVRAEEEKKNAIKHIINNASEFELQVLNSSKGKEVIDKTLEDIKNNIKPNTLQVEAKKLEDNPSEVIDNSEPEVKVPESNIPPKTDKEPETIVEKTEKIIEDSKEDSKSQSSKIDSTEDKKPVETNKDSESQTPKISVDEDNQVTDSSDEGKIVDNPNTPIDESKVTEPVTTKKTTRKVLPPVSNKE